MTEEGFGCAGPAFEDFGKGLMMPVTAAIEFPSRCESPQPLTYTLRVRSTDFGKGLNMMHFKGHNMTGRG